MCAQSCEVLERARDPEADDAVRRLAQQVLALVARQRRAFGL